MVETTPDICPETRPDRCPDTWPLRRGETLSNHDWYPLLGHRLLSSRFVQLAVMEDRRGDIGTALILWTEAMRQDPAGTLPDCDVELASLARFATVGAWRAVRGGVLHGWYSVTVEDHRTGLTITRLGHAVIEEIVQDMHRRKMGRDAARGAATLAVKKSRIRKKMAELQVERHIVEDDRALHQLAEFFGDSGLYITHDNLRAAMVEVLGYTGQVRQFPAEARR